MAKQACWARSRCEHIMNYTQVSIPSKKYNKVYTLELYFKYVDIEDDIESYLCNVESEKLYNRLINTYFIKSSINKYLGFNVSKYIDYQFDWLDMIIEEGLIKN